MYASVLISAIIATTFALPLEQRQTQKTTGQSDSWQAAAGTETTCDSVSEDSINFDQGFVISTVLDDACAAMMPVCAYPDRAPPDTVCTATVDFKLDGPKSTIQHANVVNATGNKIDGYGAKFEVTPAPQGEDSAGVFWTVNDCYGYFNRMLQTPPPDGCQNDVGSGVGSITVGGNSTLAGTVFKVTIVPEAQGYGTSG